MSRTFWTIGPHKESHLSEFTFDEKSGLFRPCLTTQLSHAIVFQWVSDAARMAVEMNKFGESVPDGACHYHVQEWFVANKPERFSFVSDADPELVRIYK